MDRLCEPPSSRSRGGRPGSFLPSPAACVPPIHRRAASSSPQSRALLCLRRLCDGLSPTSVAHCCGFELFPCKQHLCASHWLLQSDNRTHQEAGVTPGGGPVTGTQLSLWRQRSISPVGPASVPTRGPPEPEWGAARHSGGLDVLQPPWDCCPRVCPVDSTPSGREQTRANPGGAASQTT